MVIFISKSPSLSDYFEIIMIYVCYLVLKLLKIWNSTLLLGHPVHVHQTVGQCSFLWNEIKRLSVPKITNCIRIDDKLHVRLFHNRCAIPHPSWLRYRSCTLNNSKCPLLHTSKCEYISSSILEEQQQLKFQNSDILRFPNRL